MTRVHASICVASGALFGAGVCVAGMVRPSTVLGFLDLGGAWDASLLLVMATALAIHALAWRIVKAWRVPPLGARYPGPPRRELDARLLGGAAVFGVGWGISGYCPGPAVVSLVSGQAGPWIFVGAMLVGMYLVDAFDRADG